jgi:hypothetical protein
MHDETTNRTDPAPFYWAVALVVLLASIWFALRFMGEQRFYNTALWQRLHPVVLTSEPQTVQLVEVRDRGRDALTLAQTTRGVYFLSGVRYVPAAGEKVIVQANDQWELYLCGQDGARCMTIHSFCAETTAQNLVRNESGRMEGCYAPKLAESPASQPEPPKSDQPARGPGKRIKRMAPAVGTSHPREWAWRMGLPASGVYR